MNNQSDASFLLDTTVLTAILNRRREERAINWVARQDKRKLFICDFNVYETDKMIEGARAAGQRWLARGRLDIEKEYNNRVSKLEEWKDEVMEARKGQRFRLTEEVIKEWSAISIKAKAKGMDIPIDAGIAAFAKIHGMVVATNNIKHFRHTGVPIINPHGENPVIRTPEDLQEETLEEQLEIDIDPQITR